MGDTDAVVDSSDPESPRSRDDFAPAERAGSGHPVPAAVALERLRLLRRTAGSLLLGAVAVLGSVFVFRQGLLPLIDRVFQPGPEWLSVFRRTGILLSATAGYWAYVRWHEKREATELRLKPVRLVVAGAGGAALVALPIAVLFAIGAYELVLFRGAPPALLGVAALIGIAATLEELIYRCLLFRVLERDVGTGLALALQAVLFGVGHLENTERGGPGDAAAMLVSVTMLGLLWAGVFVLTRNLWATAANHAAWNFTILASGVPLSGIEDWRVLAPLESRYAGPDWLTGGMFGPESSLLVIVSIAVAVVLLLRAARRQGAFVRPLRLDSRAPEPQPR
jgi:membrane protease YdiL (CAAX protease family)